MHAHTHTQMHTHTCKQAGRRAVCQAIPETASTPPLPPCMHARARTKKHKSRPAWISQPYTLDPGGTAYTHTHSHARTRTHARTRRTQEQACLDQAAAHLRSRRRGAQQLRQGLDAARVAQHNFADGLKCHSLRTRARVCVRVLCVCVCV